MKPFPGTVARTGKYNSYVLTEEQKEWLIRWFPVTENRRLVKASGLTESSLHRFARDLGLTKSEKGMKAIKRRQAAHIKRVCTKNGYYDSLRGKAPCDAAHEATRRMWQEIREGKREDPVTIMKRKNPHRYRQWMKRKSEERKEAIRRERMRMKWGLPRKTRLALVVMQPYTTSQICHRHNALKKGYILADTCEEGSGHRYMIYYDTETKRSQRFETNLVKDGFRIEEWQYD